MIGFTGLLMLVTLGASPRVTPFHAPKYGLSVDMPERWRVARRETDESIFVAEIPQAGPDRPGAAACELGVAPASLDEYRTRIDANARRNRRPGQLVRNEIVPARGDQPERLETLWLLRPADGPPWRELFVRIIAHRQLYTFILNVDEPTWETARPAFDALLNSAHFDPPDTGAQRLPGEANRWLQKEFRFEVDLPEGWQPVLAPDEVALLFASGPAKGVWSDNFLVLAHRHREPDLAELARTLPDALRTAEPGCEVLRCEVIKTPDGEALETVVRTRRGPFSMTVLERRFRAERFDYEAKFTVESERFETLEARFRRCLESFREVPGEVSLPGGKPA